MKPFRSTDRARSGARMPRPGVRLAVGISLLVLVGAWGCGGGGGGGGILPPPSGIVASFTPSATPAAPNRVRLADGGASGDTVVVNVVIGGPTTSEDIYSFAFDVFLDDPTVATFLDGQEAAGNALVPTGSQSLIVQVAPSSQDPQRRIVVGVTKAGGGSGNGIAGAEATIVSLPFRVLRVAPTGIRLVGSSPSIPPRALDSAGNPILSIEFDTQPATLRGS